jgi:hypothetical protein
MATEKELPPDIAGWMKATGVRRIYLSEDGNWSVWIPGADFVGTGPTFEEALNEARRMAA